IEDAFVIAVHQVDNNANQQGSLFNLSGIGGNTGRWQAHAPYKGTLYFDTANISAGRVNTGYGVSAEDNVLVSFYGSTSDNVQQVYKNGSYLVGDASGHSTTAAGNIYIGCNAGSAYQDTSIGEIILINGTVDTEDRQKLEGCLAHKWGLENALPADHPYKTAAPGGAGVSLELNGTVTDEDGTLPAATWTKEAGPGTVTFNDASAVDTTVTISEAGTYILRLTADDGLNQTVDEISITVHDAASAGYAQWAADWTTDIGATTNDFDADGLNNFGEYALGGNPTNALDHGTPPAFTQSGSGFVYVYPMRSDDETITYLVETTTNLISGVWTNQGGTAIGTNITGGDINFVTNNVGTIEKAKFIRLNIER
ncbi:MAG TPA: hypothetical protein VJ904_13975, partial [Tichowtungia sp.]|nr:hypothetical protein [Tichowtungia sp.]